MGQMTAFKGFLLTTFYDLNAETSAVLRLECSIDCISGSVVHQQNIFRLFSHCQGFFGRKLKNKTKLIGSGHHQCYINWSSAPHPSYIQTFMRIR